MLLTSWVEHNKQYSGEVENAEDDPIYNSILQAAQEVEKANERLTQLLIKFQEGR